MRGVAIAVWMAMAAGSAAAHELWISPVQYRVPAGAEVVADIRVGEDLDGPAYSYLPRDFVRFDLVQGDTSRPVAGRMGDRPALQDTADAEGLVTVVYVSKNLSLTYTKFEKFEKFARHKDFAWVLDAHLERGLSTDRFKERYVRHAKSLIAVGDGAGSDQEVGLKTEIVALANPYTDDLSDGLPVKVLLDGAPRANAQVELFASDGGADEVTVTLHTTDADGVALLPVEPGTEYLADAVVIEPVEPEDDGPVWVTHWASLTFGVPRP
ncbi:DUF4198 domain-containing protein [Pseudaestuariivita sp.]|uniref:DUF4198 domain-containing protein n=1 Tax=Pseudaestuariivita sp. TaxID=2211669 RepID=UPI00405A0805